MLRRPLLARSLATLCALGLSLPAVAGEKGPIRKLSLDPDAPVVEFFAGAAAGKLSVKLVPLDEQRANVFITNTTSETLTVGTPPTIATMSVLPQFCGNCAGGDVLTQFQQPGIGLGLPPNGLDPTGGQQLGNGQATGGGLNPALGNGPGLFPQLNQNGNNGLQQPGLNFFSIPPERSVWLKIDSVCLDHGKPTPKPKMPYVLVPIDKQVESPVLRQLLADFDPAKDDRDAIQAAAWHLSNDLSWKDLAALKVRRGNIDRPQFDRATLERAHAFVEAAKQSVDAVESDDAEQTTERVSVRRASN